MDTEVQTTLLAVVVVIAALLVLQTIALVGLVLALRKLSVRVAALMVITEDAVRDVGPALRAASEMMAESKEKMGLVSQNLLEVSKLTKQQATRIDGVMSDVSDRLRLQVIRFDRLVSDTVSRVEETTELVQNSIVQPIRELSAVLAGVRSGLEFLFRRNRSRADRAAPGRATQEEELFI